MSVTPETTPQPAVAPSYQERRAAAMAALLEEVHPSAAPEQTTEKASPTPPPADATAPAKAEHGTTESAAATPATEESTAKSPDPPKLLTPEEVQALVEKETKRARADQSETARKLVALEAELAEARAAYEKARFDAQVLFQSQSEAKRIAREQGGVRYEDLDAVTDEAVRQQTLLREQEMVARQRRSQMSEQQQAAMAAETERRTTDGTLAYNAAVADVLSAMAEAGIKGGKTMAEKLVVETYQDPIVEGDKALWRDLSTPYPIAKQRIEIVGKRMAELAIAKLTQEAIAKVEESRKEPQTYDRRQVYGEPNGTVAGERPLSYKERRAKALAEADEWVGKDIEAFKSQSQTFSF